MDQKKAAYILLLSGVAIGTAGAIAGSLFFGLLGLIIVAFGFRILGIWMRP